MFANPPKMVYWVIFITFIAIRSESFYPKARLADARDKRLLFSFLVFFTIFYSFHFYPLSYITNISIPYIYFLSSIIFIYFSIDFLANHTIIFFRRQMPPFISLFFFIAVCVIYYR